MAKESIERRMDILEKRFTSLETLLKEYLQNKPMESKNKTEIEPVTTSKFDSLSFMSNQIPNVWALQTKNLINASASIAELENKDELEEIKTRATRAHMDTYKQTLSALDKEGLTAEEVGKITKRSRNTESSYLWRLYLAGLIDRQKSGNVIKYSLKKNIG